MGHYEKNIFTETNPRIDYSKELKWKVISQCH